jgi:acetolactate synthase-1/2/3 large subunit
MKASDYVAAFLRAQGVEFVFEVVGGMTTHLVDSIYRAGEVRLISMHHEQAAAFAAEAAARLTGVPGVAMATSGPGATNLLTGIGSCYYDSTPAVFITGQVNRNEQKGRRNIRQMGFQETDIVSMARPVTKAAYRVRSANQLATVLEEAFATALAPRKGPVLVDIPMDVQRAELSGPAPRRAAPQPIQAQPSSAIEPLLRDLQNAQRPLILAGGGIRASGAAEPFRVMAERLAIPVVYSLMGVDALPSEDPFHVGMIGTYGNRWANYALGHADFLLVLGSRLDVRQTGSDVDAFGRGKTIWQVDCDEGETNNRVPGCKTLIADLGTFFAAVSRLDNKTAGRWDPWVQEIRQWQQKWPDTAENSGAPGINPNEFMHRLATASRLAGAYVTDVGCHQMWAAQSLELARDQRLLTSGGMGSMGFALPAAIGAAFSLPGCPIVMIAGDGGMQMNIQELQTVLHHRLPIKMVVIDNGAYGMVRQFQESYFEGRYPSTLWGYSAPDFVRVAKAYGIDGECVQATQEEDAALGRLWDDPTKPYLLQVRVDTFLNVYPKVAFGCPITEMEPLPKSTIDEE